MKIKKGEFRCSCCDEIKGEHLSALRRWSMVEAVEVQICGNCNFKLNHHDIRYVETMIDVMEREP